MSKKLVKRFRVSFLVVLSPIIFFTLMSNLSGEEKYFVIAMFIGVYAGGYICGYSQGRDALREVLDFMESGLRWKVLDAENLMNDSDDKAYKESQKRDDRSGEE